ncbi:MAG TPA: septation protein SpoVG [Euryarchaeota archaeon]|nr:putative septation protein SpoVG [archaeon BMS3Bbin15]HDL14603.1 septation protein SpoVG [Euryarchaeota archaeon]
MEITDIRIFRIIGSGRVKAYANVTLGEFAVHGVKVMENEKGLWVSMPRQRSVSDGQLRDVFYPMIPLRTGRSSTQWCSMPAYERGLWASPVETVLQASGEGDKRWVYV